MYVWLSPFSLFALQTDKQMICKSCFTVPFTEWLEEQEQRQRQEQQQQGPEQRREEQQHSSEQQQQQVGAEVASQLQWTGLTPKQQAQVKQWSADAAALRRTPTAGILPASGHAALLSGCDLLHGQDWPQEYCACKAGKAGVRRLRDLVAQLPCLAEPKGFAALNEQVGFRFDRNDMGAALANQQQPTKLHTPTQQKRA